MYKKTSNTYKYLYIHIYSIYMVHKIKMSPQHSLSLKIISYTHEFHLQVRASIIAKRG